MASIIFKLAILATIVMTILGLQLPEAKGLRAAYTNATVGSCSYSDVCSSGGITGVCVSISAGCCSGTSTAGLCPGSSDIKCCTLNTCSTPVGTGTCMQTSACTKGESVSGYCTGPADVQCCVTGVTPPTSSVKGVDIANSLSSTAASCYQSSGYTFVIPRGFRSTGVVDTEVCNSIKTAYSAGAKVRDTYMFPCPTCSKSASTQMSELVSYLNTNCKSQWSGRVWLDIEGKEYWLGSTSSNQAWYKALKDSCSTYGVKCGVYSSSSQWSAIFGSTSYSYGSDLPLWYAHYDNKASFSDFVPFGGWNSPHVKQYNGDITVCGMDTDVNYAIDF